MTTNVGNFFFPFCRAQPDLLHHTAHFGEKHQGGNVPCTVAPCLGSTGTSQTVPAESHEIELWFAEMFRELLGLPLLWD